VNGSGDRISSVPPYLEGKGEGREDVGEGVGVLLRCAHILHLLDQLGSMIHRLV
jgi:hypothetical protein